ncbi:hypothetical protein O983_26195 [Mycobacterium avium 09-5983]|nr:hypothetical protein O983_26195 [Mycobacterium avium 09-5983]
MPCWSGGPAYWAHVTVAVAYDLRYGEIRSQMTSGGIAKPTLILVAAAFARTADISTGRNARPTNEQLQRATGVTERTIQRARECLRLLGVATEVLRGRQRTYTERMASWRMAIATAAGPQCGHCMTTPSSAVLFTACHPTWNGPQ